MISVIVPVHNTAISDLRRCLKSIIAQTYYDWEAVIVNDGSRKEVHDELEEWALTEPRFIIVHQKNNGVSFSRNIGIEKALGEYIAFLDSDDCLKKDFMSEAMQYLNQYNLDIVIGSCEIIDGQRIKKRKCASNNGKPWIFGTANKKELNILLDYMISAHYKEESRKFNDILASRVYCKLFRKDVLEKIRFKPDIKMHEDNLFSFDTIRASRTVGVVENIWYEYYMNDYSITHQKPDKKTIENEFCFAREVYKHREKDIQNAVDMRMILIMKAICNILRSNGELKYLRKNVLKCMLNEECFITAIKYFDLSGYQRITWNEKCFAVMLKLPRFIRLPLLYILTFPALG